MCWKWIPTHNISIDLALGAVDEKPIRMHTIHAFIGKVFNFLFAFNLGNILQR